MARLINILLAPLALIASLSLVRSRHPLVAPGETAISPPRLTAPIGLRARLAVQLIWRRWPLALELAGLALWAAWVGRAYLDFSPHTWPAGSEFPMAIQGNIVWSWLGQCGDCVLWNGSINGGSPALVDLHSAVTHPLVVLPTLIWGLVVGAKVTLVICMFPITP